MNESVSLEDFQIDDSAPEGFESQGFEISDDGQATWALRKLAQSQSRIDDVLLRAAEEIDRIERWVEIATKSDTNTVNYFTERLTSYVKRVRETDGRKTLVLPDGNVSSRETKDRFKVENASAFIAWAESAGRPDLYRSKFEPDVAEIKNHVRYSGLEVIESSTGETIPGLVHVEGGISVTVEVSK